MKRLLILFLILLASVWLGLQINHDPGYVMLANHRWTIELPLWLAVLIIGLSFITFYLLVRLIVKTTALPKTVQRWVKQRQRKLAYRRTLRGLKALLQGQWSLAEKDLLRAPTKGEDALINYLGAAYAAYQQQAVNRYEEYLQLAQKASPTSLPVGIVQAHLATPEQALLILKQLQELAPQQPYLLKLLQDRYLQLKQWEKLEELLPTLHKYKVSSTADLILLEQRIYKELLQNTAKYQDSHSLITLWQRIPRHLRANIEIIKIYTQSLIHNQMTSEAEQLIRETLKKIWDTELAYRYGLITGKDLELQLTTAENWLKQHPEDSALLLSLGRICIRKQLWGKARSYFETVLRIKPTPEAYAELGQLYAHLGETQLAYEQFKQGLWAALPQNLITHDH
jgi:HemY protein